MKESEGTEKMKTIARHVRGGAMSYLKQQYKVVTAVFIVLALLFAVMAFFGLQNSWVPFAFLTGGFFSGLAGFFGMKTATYASARTANAVRRSLNSGLQVAFRSGAVMGLVVVGLALLDISAWYLILDHFVEDADAGHKLVMITTTMLTFGMGASTQALFARVGGGIYTKAADVVFRKMIHVIRLPLPIMWETMWETWQEWVPTSMNLIAALSFLQLH